MKRIAIVLALAVAIGGCSEAVATPAPASPALTSAVPAPSTLASAAPSVPAPSAEPSSSPDATPTPASASPAVLTMIEAKAAYKAIAGKYNRTLLVLQRSLKKSTSLSAEKSFWLKLSKAEKKFIDSIKATAWPPEVAPDMKALVRANVVLYRSMVEASRSKSWSDLAAIAPTIRRQDQKTADMAAIVRDILGMPTNG